MKVNRNKVVIIGAGFVGSTILYTLLSNPSVAEIAIVDINSDKAKGEALDASHATSFAYSPNIQVRHGDYSDCKDAGIIVMTAGPSAKPGEVMDRIMLAQVNIKVLDMVMEQIITYTKEAILIIVSNPVDVLTYHAQTHYDYPKEKILGTGTLLDTARFRRIISHLFRVDAKNVHGYILGEHGQTAFATWSHTSIASIPLSEMVEQFPHIQVDHEAIIKEVKQVGFDVLKSKGFTNFGVAKSVERIIHCILSNELSILPLSSTLHGLYDIFDVSLSVPCILSNEGIDKQLVMHLDDSELEHLNASATFLKQVYRDLNPTNL